MDERIENAGQLYDRAVFSGDASGLPQAGRELDAAEAELALARGKLAHLRFLLQRDENPDEAREDPDELPLFERAARLYAGLGDVRGEGEALFWVGCCFQVVRRDNAAAVPALRRSLELATRAGDRPTMSEALRHLGIEAHLGDGRTRPGSGWRSPPGCAGNWDRRPAWPAIRSGWPTSPRPRTGGPTPRRCSPRRPPWPAPAARSGSSARCGRPRRISA